MPVSFVYFFSAHLPVLHLTPKFIPATFQDAHMCGSTYVLVITLLHKIAHDSF